jgi:5-formyltetrahydrofolate cyclo-ligase
VREDARVAETKSGLRAHVRAARARRSADDRAAAAEALARQCAAVLPLSGTVAAYLSLPEEPGTGPLLAACAQRGLTVLVPRVRDDHLDWAAWSADAPTRPGPFGIAEPSGPAMRRLDEAAVVLLPATAVDAAGRRLGQGGGYYDRALAALGAPRPLLVALVFDDEVLDTVPAEEHDQRVDVIVTPSRVLRRDGP